MKEGEVRIALREFVAGKCHGFNEIELEAIQEAARGARHAIKRRTDLAEAEIVAAEARGAMGVEWTAAFLVYVDNLAKIEEARRAHVRVAGIFYAPITIALFTPRGGSLQHVLEQVHPSGLVDALCGEFSRSSTEDVLKTMKPWTGAMTEVRRWCGPAGWSNPCRRCIRAWAPLTLKWLPKQTSWTPELRRDEEWDDEDDDWEDEELVGPSRVELAHQLVGQLDEIERARQFEENSCPVCVPGALLDSCTICYGTGLVCVPIEAVHGE